MPSTDDSHSLRAEIARRWEAELFSPDTVVALIAVLVAVPAGLVVAWLLDPRLIYPVWLVGAVGPTLSDISGGIRDLSRIESVRAGLTLAGGHLALVLVLFYAALTAGGTDWVAVAVAVLGAFAVGNVATRRWLDDRAATA